MTVALPLRIFMLTLAAVLIAAAGLGVANTIEELQARGVLMESPKKTIGQVTAIEESYGTSGPARHGLSKMYTPVITYEVAGKSYTIKDSRTGNPERHAVGDELAVTYAGADPANAYLDSQEFNPLWNILGVFFMGGLAGLFLLVGFARSKPTPEASHG